MTEQKMTDTFQPDGLSEETFFQSLTKSNRDFIYYVYDLSSHTYQWSKNTREFLDYSENEEKSVKQLFEEALHPNDLALLREDEKEILEGKKDSLVHQLRIRNANQDYLWIRCTGNIITDKESGKKFFIGYVFRLDKEIIYDYLTNLPDMNYFLKLAKERQKQNQGKDCYIIYFDIRNFKLINIQKGIEKGNQLLLTVANLLSHHFQGDLLSRFSDDHFVVLTSKENYLTIIKDVQKEFSSTILDENISLKAGIYILKDEDIHLAVACDLAKASVDYIQNKAEDYYIYDKVLERELTKKQDLLYHFRMALENHEFQVYFQPIIRSLTDRVCAFEALSRWEDPKYGFLPPADFIPTLEKSGDIYLLDQYVIEEVCETLERLLRKGDNALPISINLSRMDFLKCDIVSYIEECMRKHHLPRDLLCIEITESILVENRSMLKERIQKFHDLGYSVWMDDFGSGYSSLNSLQEYPFDLLKMDMHFLSSFGGKSKEIMKSIVSMAKKLSLHVLAEGVEKEEHALFLKDIGCELLQGYYYSKPVPAKNGLAILSDHVRYEPNRLRQYYDKLGAIDFLSDRPFAVLEYDLRSFRFLFAAESYQNVWKTVGFTSLKQVQDALNNPDSTLCKRLRTFAMTLKEGEPRRDYYYTVYSNVIHQKSRLVTRSGFLYAFEVEIENMDANSVSQAKTVIQESLGLILKNIDDVYLFDLKHNSFQIVRQSSYGGIQPFNTSKTLTETLSDAQSFIAPKQRDEYKIFTDPATLVERLSHLQSSYMNREFLTMNENGGYIPKIHTLILNEDKTKVVYEIQTEAVRNPREKAALASLESLRPTKAVAISYKDNLGRYVNVNDAFLLTYHLKNTEEVIGKTDKEIGWLIHPEDSDSVDKKVIEEGKVINNDIQTILVQGVRHKLLATKEPVYQAGKIVGVLSYSILADQLLTSIEHDLPKEFLDSVDSFTNLSSASGLVSIFNEYMDDYLLKKEDFASIELNVEETHKNYDKYDVAAIRAILRKIADIISASFENRGACGRIDAGHFILLMRYHKKEEVHTIVKEIEDNLLRVKEVDSYPATFSVSHRVLFASEEKDSYNFFFKSFFQMARQLPQNRPDYQIDLNQVFYSYENISDAIYVSDMDSYDLLYMNKVCRDLYGIPVLDTSKKQKCYQVLQHLSHPCDHCTNCKIQNGKPYEWEFFSPYLDNLYHLQDQMFYCNGHRLRVEVAKNMAMMEPSSSLKEKEHTLFMISECLRLSLEEKDVNIGIQKLLEYLGRGLDGDRTWIFELSDNKWSNTYEWCRDDVASKKENSQNLPYEIITPWEATFQKQQYLFIEDTSAIPDREQGFFHYLLSQSIHSLILIPIYEDKKIITLFGIDNPPSNKTTSIIAEITTIAHVIHTMIERRDMTKKLEELSYRDSLSKLGNRHAVNHLYKAEDESTSIGGIFGDLCALKYINDNYGHLAGDQMLIETANILRDNFSQNEVFRWGGDEFLVLSQNLSEEDFLNRCKKISDECKKNHVPLAFGSLYQKEGYRSLESFIQEIDEKMYQNKRSLYDNDLVLDELSRNRILKKFTPEE